MTDPFHGGKVRTAGIMAGNRMSPLTVRVAAWPVVPWHRWSPEEPNAGEFQLFEHLPGQGAVGMVDDGPALAGPAIRILVALRRAQYYSSGTRTRRDTIDLGACRSALWQRRRAP